MSSLVLAEKVRLLDGEAAEWGLNPFALVEAAGRACAAVLVKAFPRFFVRHPAGSRPAAKAPKITVLAGSGNNAADSLVMLRALLLDGRADLTNALVLVSRLPAAGGETPLSEALLAIQKMGVSVRAWDREEAALSGADIIIDGIAGTGLQGPLRGKALEMAEAVNRLREDPPVDGSPGRPLVVSIDVPSGNFDEWRPGMPLLAADATLAIEPQKRCLYTPAVRSRAGRILSVGGIFPPALIEKYRDAERLSWRDAARRLPEIWADTYKYERGLVEIRAGATGTAGAARLAARGAQAAGAGLVRLIVDDSLYPILAPAATGIMVAPGGASPGGTSGRFQPDAVLLGPGWGRGQDRAALLEQCLPLEEQGVPLILDADAVYLAKGLTFHGRAILTPHAGEFAAYTGLPKEEILAGPAPVLRRFAKEKNAHILFKSHVLYAAAPDGRLGIIDGMAPVLAAGGSGDVLAGICAALAARLRAAGKQRAFDGYVCACAAAALLMEAARSPETAGRFIDPSDLACAASSIAGKAWLPADLTNNTNKDDTII